MARNTSNDYDHYEKPNARKFGDDIEKAMQEIISENIEHFEDSDTEMHKIDEMNVKQSCKSSQNATKKENEMSRIGIIEDMKEIISTTSHNSDVARLKVDVMKNMQVIISDYSKTFGDVETEILRRDVKEAMENIILMVDQNSEENKMYSMDVKEAMQDIISIVPNSEELKPDGFRIDTDEKSIVMNAHKPDKGEIDTAESKIESNCTNFKDVGSFRIDIEETI